MDEPQPLTIPQSRFEAGRQRLEVELKAEFRQVVTDLEFPSTTDKDVHTIIYHLPSHRKQQIAILSTELSYIEDALFITI